MPPHHSLDLCVDLPAHHLPCFDRNPLSGTAYLLRLSVSFAKVRNINLMSIDYAFRPRLRSRLTLGGRPLPQETLLNRCSRFSLLFVTHTGILTCSRSTTTFVMTSTLLQRSPTTCTLVQIQSFGVMLSPGKSSAQFHSTSELLRTL